MSRKTVQRGGGPRAERGGCVRYRELISATVDGEVDDLERASVERHLRSCPRCLQFRDFAQRAGTMMRDEGEAAQPVAFDGQMLARAVRSRHRRSLGAGVAVAVVASLLVGIALGGSLVLGLEADGAVHSFELSLPRLVAARNLDPSYVPYLEQPLVAAWDTGVIRAGTRDEKQLFLEAPMSWFEQSHYRPEQL